MKKPLFPAHHNDPSDNARPPAWKNLFNIEMIEAILRDAARIRKSLSYAETLYLLGYQFSRPKMRALCVALTEVDIRAAQQNQPGLAVLVVRASDGLPGAGWWVDKNRRRYQGPWEGPQAQAYIKKKQNEVFKYWQDL